MRTKEWNYILKMQTEQGEITVYCHRDRVLLGATFEEGCVEVRVNQECV